jgi:hypothetical protein
VELERVDLAVAVGVAARELLLLPRDVLVPAERAVVVLVQLLEARLAAGSAPLLGRWGGR